MKSRKMFKRKSRKNGGSPPTNLRPLLLEKMAEDVFRIATTIPTPTFFSVLPNYPPLLPNYPPGILEAKLLYDNRMKKLTKLGALFGDFESFNKIYVRGTKEKFVGYYLDEILEDRDNILLGEIRKLIRFLKEEIDNELTAFIQIMVDVNHERSDRLKRWNLIKIANKYITRAHLLNKEKLKWQNYDDVINVTPKHSILLDFTTIHGNKITANDIERYIRFFDFGLEQKKSNEKFMFTSDMPFHD